MFGFRFKTVGMVTVTVSQRDELTDHKSFVGQYVALLQEDGKKRRRVRTEGYAWGVTPLADPEIQLWVLGGPLPVNAVAATKAR